jgi:PAS domain S-box-containing protein
MNTESDIKNIYRDYRDIGLFVANNVEAMLAYWDKDLMCRFANDAYKEWFGIGQLEMVDKITLPELLGPLFEQNLTHINAVLQGIPQKFVRKIKIPSGQVRYTMASYHPDIIDGEVVGFYVHVVDVSELKRLEQELSQTNEIAKIGSWEIDLKTQKIIWSKVTKMIHEVSDDYEPNLKTAIDFFKEGTSRELITAAIEKAMKYGSFYDLELQLITAEGNEKWTRAIGQAEFETGECVRLFGTFQDIDSQKRIQDKLQISEDKFRGAFEHSAIGMALTSIGGEWLKVNKRLQEILGYDESELLSLTFLDITHTDDRARNMEFVRKILKGDISSYSLEKRFIHKSGKIVPVLLSVSLVRDITGAPMHFVTQIEDMTVRKQAEENLRRHRELEIRNKEMEQFTYAASHDMREPLITLSSYAQLLKKEYGGRLDHNGEIYLRYISDSANRMMTLIKGLLDYSLIGKERNLQIVDCSELVQTVKNDLQILIRETGTTIYADELPVVSGYKNELYMLFQNLISNAIKFRKKDQPPRIKISAVQTNRKWLFKVEDNGIGIDPKDKDKIFVIFKRLHTRQDIDGNGIGLAHCKKIVEMHHGNIWVESSPGEGATFFFTLAV